MALGMYRQGTPGSALGAEVLAAFDSAIPDNPSGLSGTLLPSTETETNLLVSDLSESAVPSGDLRVWLEWASGDAFGSCAFSGTAKMGLYLQGAFGPASSLRLSDTYPCDTTVLFEDIPKTTEPYTLAVYGLDESGQMRWYQYCDDLFAETVSDDRQPAGYRCAVSALLPR